MGWNSKHSTQVRKDGSGGYAFSCSCGCSGSRRTQNSASRAASDHRMAGVRRVVNKDK